MNATPNKITLSNGYSFTPLTEAQRAASKALGVYLAKRDGAKPQPIDISTSCDPDEETEANESQRCGDCRDGTVEGFNRRGSWKIANYQTCPTCGGSGVVRS